MVVGTVAELRTWLGAARVAAVERERQRTGEIQRDSKFDTLTVIWLCLRVAAHAATRSLAEIVAQARADLPGDVAFTVSGFCKARQRLSVRWLHQVWGQVVQQVLGLGKTRHPTYQGLRVYATDKTTVGLPETRALWRRFGCHRTSKGLGQIAAELITVLDVNWRVPVAWHVLPAASSEKRLIQALYGVLQRPVLLLMDSGFYAVAIFRELCRRGAHLLIPMPVNHRPTVLRQLGHGDYLCELVGYGPRRKGKRGPRLTLIVRIIYVYRPGFRRRRLVTTLLDPQQYPAAELAVLYHDRWHIETFFRDFKHTLSGNRWHCQTPATFEQELVSLFLLIALTRLAMAQAANARGWQPGELSFAGALTAVRVFLAHLTRGHRPVAELYTALVAECGRHRLRPQPGRAFLRDTQRRRRRARGLERGRVGRPRKRRALPPVLRPELLAGRLLG